MARSLVLSNGSFLACLDEYGRVRDLYFPYVGRENHILDGNALGFGVWVDGKIRWLNDPGWETSVMYEDDSLVSSITAVNRELGIRCEFRDVVYNEHNILLRSITVSNEHDRDREVRLFFNQQFTIGETTHADTAYYNPREKAIIHYKGRRVFLVSGKVDNKMCSDYTVGLFQTEGKEGTWRDAEDGELAKNPIEHGSVDSTLGFHLTISKNSSKQAFFWVAAGETFRDVQPIHEMVARKTPEHIIKSTHDFWHAWTNKSRFTFHGLDDDVVDLFKKSLLITRAHCDNGGGIIASGDGASGAYGRDTYGYVWPRDGAYIALAMEQAGYDDVALRFADFINDVITDDGYILHKYQPDRSLGSSWHPWVHEGKEQLAIQEDETSSQLFFLWEYYKVSKDIEYIEEVYNMFIKRIADFLLSYRDKETGLPGPSYDLWEEKYGISTYTAASVYSGLTAASRFAELLGKKEEAGLYCDAADRMKQAILTHLYDEKEGYFVKMVNRSGSDFEYDKTVDVSSFFGVFRFGVLPIDDPRLESCFQVVRKQLIDPIPIGGCVRYTGDKYFTVDHDLPGNPWIITTLWCLQYTIMKAKNEEDLAHVNEELRWITQHALKSGVLSEQLDPHTGKQVSIAPLAWSHGEYIHTVVEYMNKLERLGIRDACAPIEESPVDTCEEGN